MGNLSTQDILTRLNTAIKSITTQTLGETKLTAEKAERFVRAVEKKAVILGEARRLDMNSHTKDIDRVGFGSRIMQAAAEGTAPEDESKAPTFATNKLVSVEAIAVVSITDSTLEDNIEKENFEDTLVDMMGNRAGVDMEELFVQGDTDDEEDDYLALTDGWLKLAKNAVSSDIADTEGGGSTTLSAAAGAGTQTLPLTAITGFAKEDYIRIGAGMTQEYFEVTDVGEDSITIDGQLKFNHAAGEAVVEIDALPDFSPYDVEDMFEAMLNALPSEYIQDPSEWRFYVPWAVENDYRNKLKGRGTALGDDAQTSAKPLAYKGIPVKVSANIPKGSGLLTHPDNTVYGIYRDVKIEPDRIPKARKTDFVLSVRIDANYEDENGAVAASGYIGL
jgi:hypothetical protein